MTVDPNAHIPRHLRRAAEHMAPVVAAREQAQRQAALLREQRLAGYTDQVTEQETETEP